MKSFVMVALFFCFAVHVQVVDARVKGTRQVINILGKRKNAEMSSFYAPCPCIIVPQHGFSALTTERVADLAGQHEKHVQVLEKIQVYLEFLRDSREFTNPYMVMLEHAIANDEDDLVKYIFKHHMNKDNRYVQNLLQLWYEHSCYKAAKSI